MIIKEYNNVSNSQMKKEFLFSCVMAIYNVELYLREAIESVINQTLDFNRYIQLILVNDGSTDNCEKICLEYEKKYPENIIYIYKKNGGVCSARNIGLKFAMGEYITFIDSDDYYSKNALNRVNYFFNKYGKIIDVASIEMLDFNGKMEQHASYNHHFYQQDSIIDLNVNSNFAIFNPGMIFIKREKAQKYQFNENVKIGEDILYCYKILIEKPKCGVIAKEKYMHRIRENSATTSPRKLEDTIKLLDIVIKDLIIHSQNITGTILPFISDLSNNLIIHEIINKFKQLKIDEKEILLSKIKEYLDYIGTNNIRCNDMVSNEQKKMLCEIKESSIEDCMKFFNYPLVSIVIPAYNASKYLKEAIDSAIAQTYKNIEIIVVNDGSKDNGKTERIAKSYGSKIKYFNKENGGVSTALNYGIKKMTGEYFSWLSHDDKYYPEKVEKQINYMKFNNLLDKKVILYSDYDLMDNHSRIFATSIKDHEELVQKPEYALLRGAINGLSLLIPKEAFSEFGLFNEELKCVQDYELWERLQKGYKFVHQAEILVTTRLHKKQQGNTSPYMLKEGNKFWIDLIKHTSKCKKEELEKNEYNFYVKMHKFLITTPYKEAIKYVEKEIEKIDHEKSIMINDIKVSVIIPFYNRIPKLIKAIESVLEQTHKNIELILIDDGSSDSVKSINRLIEQNHQIKYIRNDRNYGAAYSRNRGIEHATGKYIAFLDSDDYFEKEKIKIQLTEMYKTESKFSHTSYIKQMGDYRQVVNTAELTGDVIPRIIGACSIATPTIMIETNFLKENNLKYCEDMEYGEDVCFYLEALRKTKLLGINKPLSVVNINENSCAYNVEKQLKGLKTIIRYVLADNELEKYDYEIGLLFREYIRVCDIKNENPIFYEQVNMQNMLSSTSWKITKPIRFTKNVINLYKTEGILYTAKTIIKKILRKAKILK